MQSIIKNVTTRKKSLPLTTGQYNKLVRCLLKVNNQEFVILINRLVTHPDTFVKLAGDSKLNKKVNFCIEGLEKGFLIRPSLKRKGKKK